MKDIKITMDSEELDFDINNPDFPITFSYQLEDVSDFQKKKSSESLGLKLPPTLKNQRILNTFHNTAYLDSTESGFFKGIRDFVAEVSGIEIFKGKAFPKKVTKRGGRPISYEINVFGNNANWMIPLKDVTLYDLLKHIEFKWTKMNVINSWGFDGTDESLPYVFAPVKYAKWLDQANETDKNYAIDTMKPSLSVYWIMYWGFKKAGYQINSDFMNTNWGRRLVMPWTFGSFLSSEGTKYDIHKFLARTPERIRFEEFNGFADLNVRDDIDGTYDNNNTIPNPPGDYEYIQEDKEMRWTYNTPHYGVLEASFQMALFYDYKIDMSSEISIDVHFFVNGNIKQIKHVRDNQAPTFGSKEESDLVYIWFDAAVNPGDVVSAKVYLYIRRTKTATVARCYLSVDEYKLAYFKIPLGGQISFDSYLKLQNEKFLDLLRGMVDTFNLSIQTDPVKKIVCIEPSHEYFTGNEPADMKRGYFDKDQIINWTEKEDISMESEVESYDNNARQFTFKFKDDNNDGALKIVQDRFKITLGSGKFIFDERFKAEKKEYSNRYFSPVMHYFVTDFEQITGVVPQMICMVPENISNTSSPESENTFNPKLAYYKGLVSGVGGWKFDDKNMNELPFMFAVNYKPGGENDPILSYSDEKIGDDPNFKIGYGLIRRFFLPRLVIMNNGQWLKSNFNLNNYDVVNWFHRERIDLNGELFELININKYSPLKRDSVKCTFRKWIPVSELDSQKIYPSKQSVLTEAIEVMGEENENTGNDMDVVLDTQYNRLLCLYNDIPRFKIGENGS